MAELRQSVQFDYDFLILHCRNGSDGLPRRNRAAQVRSLQLCVFRLGFLQDGDVGVGVFPESEEVPITGAAQEFANPALRIHLKNPVDFRPFREHNPPDISYMPYRHSPWPDTEPIRKSSVERPPTGPGLSKTKWSQVRRNLVSVEVALT